MVFEIDMTHNVAHITSLDRPTATLEPETENVDVPSESDEPWPDSFNSQLSPYLSEALIGDLKTLFLEGAEPPNVEAAEGGEANPTKDGIEDGKHKGKRGGKKGKAKKDHRQVSSGVSIPYLDKPLVDFGSPSRPRKPVQPFTKLSGSYLKGN